MKKISAIAALMALMLAVAFPAVTGGGVALAGGYGGDGGTGNGGDGGDGGEGDGGDGGLSPGAAAAIGGQGPDGGGTVGRDKRLSIPLGQGGGSRPSRGIFTNIGPF